MNDGDLFVEVRDSPQLNKWFEAKQYDEAVEYARKMAKQHKTSWMSRVQLTLGMTCGEYVHYAGRASLPE